MRALWLLSRMRVLDVTRSASSAIAFFGVPIVILLMLAVVFGHGHPFERRSVSLVGDPPSVAKLVQELAHRDELRLEVDSSEATARRKLEVRAVEAVVIARQSERRVLVGLRAAIWGRGLAALAKAELVETPISERGYLHFLFPGLLCSSVMLAGLYGMGYAMARYRQNSFLKKLATTPVSRGTFVIAQVLGRAVLVVLQVASLLVCGLYAFSLPAPFGSMLSASVVAVVGLFVFCGLGFALACVIRSDAVLSDVISALALPITLFSGMFFPIDVLPRPLFELCRWLPSTLMIDAARATLLYGAGLTAVALPLLLLLLWGALAFALSLRLFRWHD